MTDRLIPTTSKSKISSALAYPVGAQSISQSLASVPQFEQLELMFTDNRYKVADSLGNLPILAGRYIKHNLGLSASHSMDESGSYGPKWEIQIYTVPKQHSTTIRKAVTEQGFGLLSDWLCEKRSNFWLTKSHEILLWYSMADDRVVSIASDL
jgi:hypothetical protein